MVPRPQRDNGGLTEAEPPGTLLDMTRRRRNPVTILACIVVVASFTWACVHASSLHTGERCHQDLDCFACRWASTSVGLIAPTLVHTPALVNTGELIFFEDPLPIDVPGPAPISRGPPPTA